MGQLTRCGVLALSWAAAGPAIGSPVTFRWQPIIHEAATRFGVPEDWIEHVIIAESGGKTVRAGHPIRSPTGAIGLMQLMPATWGELRLRYGLGTDPDDPHDNILAGVAYLRAMYDRFGYPGLFAAYNAGPARYARHLETGTPLPSETRAYLGAVTAGPTNAVGAVAVRPPTALFSISPSSEAASNPIFVIRHDVQGQSSGGI